MVTVEILSPFAGPKFARMYLSGEFRSIETESKCHMYLSDDKVRFGLVDEMLLKGRILLCVEKLNCCRLVEVVVLFVNIASGPGPFLATSNGLTNF